MCMRWPLRAHGASFPMRALAELDEWRFSQRTPNLRKFS